MKIANLLLLASGIALGIALYAVHAHADEAPKCELTQATAMVHLNKAAKKLPATVTIIDGTEASDLITGANALQIEQVFVGDTIAVIGLSKEDTVQVTIFKEGCRTYQSRI
jgi:hypothetical protein